jgi:ATP-dependent RNA helicase RhlE
LTENAESRNKSRSYSRKQRSEQEPALAGFKDGTLTALVATDIAARGLDIPLLPHVVNFELPIPEDYVHRIGRTGRAGANGEAISLFSPDETVFLRDIEKLIGMKLPTENIAGFEPDPNASTAPIKQGQGRPQRTSAPRKQRLILPAEVLIIVLVLDVQMLIMTDVPTKSKYLEQNNLVS